MLQLCHEGWIKYIAGMKVICAVDPTSVTAWKMHTNLTFNAASFESSQETYHQNTAHSMMAAYLNVYQIWLKWH